jgi:hypothetical protein
MKTERCRRPYPNLAGNVTLDVVVGEGHKGSIVVETDDAEVARGSDELRGVPLGRADELVGQRLRVQAAVSPVNVASRRASLTCVFLGAALRIEETCGIADHEDALVRFVLDFPDA